MTSHTEGDILFEDAFDGASVDAWPIPPISLIEDPEHGKVLHLKAGDPNAGLWLGWTGNESWRSYRLEVEVLPLGDRGFLGLDFHVQKDESGCCNFHFGVPSEGGGRLFEGCGRWDDTNTSWKLGPLSQRSAPVPSDGWLRLRLDAGETVANLYQGDDPDPVFTIYDLPFASGGIRLWRYYASAYFRNLRVTALKDVEPILDDVWGGVLGPGVIRNWSISRMFPRGFGSDDPVAAASADDAGWREVSGDRRGVVNVIGIAPGEYCRKGVVFARATLRAGTGSSAAASAGVAPDASSDAATGATGCFRLTYTDQLSMWCNGRSVFDGERRGWNDPGRSEADGWGRLMPDQFEVKCDLEPGDNEILVRLEINEPLFGSGFWVRAV